MDGILRLQTFSKYVFPILIPLVTICVVQFVADGQSQSDKTQSSPFDIVSSDAQMELLAMFKLTQDLRSRDMRLALQNAEAALNSAENVSDPDFEKTAKLQLHGILSFAKGMNRNPESILLHGLKVDPNGHPTLRLHSGLMLLELRRNCLDPKLHSGPILRYIQDAANECEDKDLILRRCCAELYFRVFRLDESVSSPVVNDLLITMESFAPYEGYPDALAFELLFESQAASEKHDENLRLSKLKEAKSVAAKTGNRYLQTKCIIFEVGLTRKNSKPEELLKELDEGLKLATELGSLDLVDELSGIRARILRDINEPEEAILQFELLKSSPFFDHADPFAQDSVNRNLTQQSDKIGAHEQAESYRKEMTSPIDAKRFKRLSELANEIEARRAAAEEAGYQKEKLLVAATEKSNRDTAAVAFFQKYSLITTAVILVAIPWLLLYLIRNHLKKVENELASEKVISFEHRKNYNDLELRLQRIQRMESLGLMAGSVAHDFNNILVGVLGNAEIIRLKNDLGDKNFVNQRVDSIIKSAEKAANLSKQMLAYAGKQIVTKQVTEINSLIRQFQSVLESACFEEQTLVLDLSRQPVCAKVDPTQIEQILLNLVTNAVEASPEGGTITIRSGKQVIGEVEDDPSLFGSRTTGGELGFIEVVDDGVGISQQELERIFEPFYSKSKNMGRGLGLSVVYGAVEGHDGLIQCRSDLGEGTSFKILLPIESDESLEAQTEVPAISEFHSMLGVDETLQGQMVLIIDDEEPVLDLCKQLVSLNGFNVITANNGEQGVEKILAHRNQLACVLLDVVMPEMGGNEVLREIERLDVDVPVVLMSGFSQTKLESFLERPNVLRIIQKPFHAIEIKQAIRDGVELSISRKGMSAHASTPK